MFTQRSFLPWFPSIAMLGILTLPCAAQFGGNPLAPNQAQYNARYQGNVAAYFQNQATNNALLAASNRTLGSPSSLGVNPWLMNSFNPMMNNPMLMNPMLMNPMLMNPMLMNPMFTNPMLMNPMINNPMMNPMLNNPAMMNPMMNNPMLMNPMMNNPFLMNNPMNMNPALNPWQMNANSMLNPAANPWQMQNAMMPNAMMNPWAQQFNNPLMMQPGVFNPVNQFGPGLFPRGF